MSSGGVQLLVLAGIAIFLILKLRDVLGTREGFEEPRQPQVVQRTGPALSVVPSGTDPDITDYVDEHSDAANALTSMKQIEPSFGVGDFIGGARGAYEMILMGFENGDIDEIRPFLSEDVAETFDEVIENRRERGLTVEAEFVGVREVTLHDANFDVKSNTGEITIRFIGELKSVVRDNGGDIVEGDMNTVKRQKDVWTFAREMGSDNPNWQLVQTGE